jgi:regulator of PEP synthase PpsR (kinase-PPPase family)
VSHQIFVVSDATGETGERFLRSALVQFPHVEVEIERRGGVREPEQVREIVALARANDATILHTLVSHRLRGLMLSECRRQAVDAMDLMGPVLDRLTVAFHARPQEQPGLFEQLREARTRAIEAVDFAFRHDDGQHSSDYDRAEMLLVGVSRTMKTPLCLYLAHRGWFAANLPIVKGVSLPAVVDRLPARRVFGLTMRPARLLELRRTRAEYLRMTGGDYAELPAIRAELHEAEELFRQRGWNVVDVTGKSIEEIARSMIDLRQLQEE